MVPATARSEYRQVRLWGNGFVGGWSGAVHHAARATPETLAVDRPGPFHHHPDKVDLMDHSGKVAGLNGPSLWLVVWLAAYCPRPGKGKGCPGRGTGEHTGDAERGQGLLGGGVDVGDPVGGGGDRGGEGVEHVQSRQVAGGRGIALDPIGRGVSDLRRDQPVGREKPALRRAAETMGLTGKKHRMIIPRWQAGRLTSPQVGLVVWDNRDVTPPDILAQIDAATEGLCACGCGRPLSDSGASAWFAQQDCQHAWMGQQATDPDDVYDRPDADDIDDEPFPAGLVEATRRSISEVARTYSVPPPIVEPQPRPVSAALTVQMSDGQTVTIEVPAGAFFDLEMEYNRESDDFDPWAGPHRLRFEHQTARIALNVQQPAPNGSLFILRWTGDQPPTGLGSTRRSRAAH